MDGYGIRGFGFYPTQIPARVRGTPEGQASGAESVVELDAFALTQKRVVVEDTDGRANLDLGFVRDHNGKTRLSVLNPGDGAEDFVEVSVPLPVEDNALRGRGTLIRSEHGFSMVAIEVKGDAVEIRATKDQQQRTFIYRSGTVSEPEREAEFAVDRLLADAKDPVDISEGEDYWINATASASLAVAPGIIGDVYLPKSE